MKFARAGRTISANLQEGGVADQARILNYRQQAADMMARASNAKSEDIRATYQILAEKWNWLAETASPETSVAETGLLLDSATRQ
jgi:hypothetical protein